MNSVNNEYGYVQIDKSLYTLTPMDVCTIVSPTSSYPYTCINGIPYRFNWNSFTIRIEKCDQTPFFLCLLRVRDGIYFCGLCFRIRKDNEKLVDRCFLFARNEQKNMPRQKCALLLFSQRCSFRNN